MSLKKQLYKFTLKKVWDSHFVIIALNIKLKKKEIKFYPREFQKLDLIEKMYEYMSKYIMLKNKKSDINY
jgi:hypothetical protein